MSILKGTRLQDNKIQKVEILEGCTQQDIPARVSESVVMGAPMDALAHAVLSLRALPQHQRDIWRRMFGHYIFRRMNPSKSIFRRPAGATWRRWTKKPHAICVPALRPGFSDGARRKTLEV